MLGKIKFEEEVLSVLRFKYENFASCLPINFEFYFISSLRKSFNFFLSFVIYMFKLSIYNLMNKLGFYYDFLFLVQCINRLIGNVFLELLASYQSHTKQLQNHLRISRT
uniref:Putative ovule protein n=1 Tax=Solanum chacoense TaxID=4108 RepID=A0A0V0IEY9_SOLCH